MALIYFVRHGQTDWNADRRIQGHVDVPINALGRSQAARNGGLLAELMCDPKRFDFVASPLLRAQQTMEIIRAQLGLAPLDYRTDDRLREISFGDWAGRTIAQLEQDHPEEFAIRLADIWHHAPPAGESFCQLSARVLAWLSDTDRDAVVVAHGGVSRCLRGHYLGLPFDEIVHLDVPQDKVLMIENGSLTWL